MILHLMVALFRSWICRKDWKLHGTATGGFFRCNIWQEDEGNQFEDPSASIASRQIRNPGDVDAEDVPSDQGYGTAIHSARTAWKEKQEMARFLHHYTRWEAHSDSASLERTMGDTACARLAPVVEAAIDFNGFDDFNFGGKGKSVLCVLVLVSRLASQLTMPLHSIHRTFICPCCFHRAARVPLCPPAQLRLFFLSLSCFFSGSTLRSSEPPSKGKDDI
jgi:hypothetical protein